MRFTPPRRASRRKSELVMLSEAFFRLWWRLVGSELIGFGVFAARFFLFRVRLFNRVHLLNRKHCLETEKN